MRLPGTRYQEPGWEQVRKLLGQCALAVFARCDPGALCAPGQQDAALATFVELLVHALHATRTSARAQAPGNSYGDSVLELAQLLACELGERPADWAAFAPALASAHAPALLRKKVNDMFALLRDKVDAEHYQVACGRACSPNRMYAYRMLDTAYGDIASLFGNWRAQREQVGSILDRVLGEAVPIEVRQLATIQDCRPEWILRWSASRLRFTGAPGPLHTRSKRFDSLKDRPEKIGAMLAEIGEYASLSANRDAPWLHDLDSAGAWLDDYWRVLDESGRAATPGPDCLLGPGEEEFGAPAAPQTHDDDAAPDSGMSADELDAAVRRAQSVSLPPGFVQAAAGAQDAASWCARQLAGQSMALRLAVYAKLLGVDDDSYPDAWRDPATGLLPTMAQLAALDAISLPTLRKRRDAAIASLGAAAGISNGRRE